MIVFLYLLKLRRKERVVSSTMLWRDAVADIQANAPFQKLKKSLLLLLQLLALLFLVFAIARPFIKARGMSENRIVVILDASASMQSTDMRPSRFEVAKSRTLGVVRDMGPGDTMLVITAGAKTRVVASFTSDKKALSSAISQLKPVDTGCNMRQAMVLALSLVAGKSAVPPRIAVFSDGGFNALSDLSAGNARINFIKIGRSCDNVAITGLDSRKTLSGDQQVFVGLRNYSMRERKFNLELYLNDQLLDIREETMAPGETRQEILSNTSNLDGRVTARLDISDDLTADNTGSVYLTKPRKISVLLVTKGNLFLQNALNLDTRTQLTRTDSLPADFGKHGYDLTVFDRIAPPASLPSGGYLLINASAPQGPAETGESVERPSVVDSAQNNPVTAYIDFGSVRIAKANYLKPKPWAVSVIDGEKGSLGVAGAKDNRSFVQIPFDLLQSDFPLRVGFPIFVANCIDYLAASPGARNESSGVCIRTGQPMYIDIPPGTEQIAVTNPDGNKQSLKVTQTPLIYDDTERAGVYKISGKGIRNEFACNLASARESATAPIAAVSVGGKEFNASGRPVETNRELYGPLLLLVLAVLSFEWYVYRRRL